MVEQFDHYLRVLRVMIILSVLPLSDLVSQTLLKGVVLDETSEPIGFATIGIPSHDLGVVAFEDGSFSLIVEESYLGDTVVISAVGYHRKRIAVSDLLNNSRVVMLHQTINLDAVFVTPGEYISMTLGAGKARSSNSFSVVSPNSGSLVAALFNEARNAVWIDRIKVSTVKQNITSFSLRCRVFSVGKGGYPQSDLLSTDLIEESAEKKGVMVFELEEPLWVDEPFYVAFEWVMSKKQKDRVEASSIEFPLEAVTNKDLVDSGLKPVIHKGKKIRYFNASGNLVSEQDLNSSERALLRRKEEVSPRVLFQSLKKGAKTIYGSDITGKWSPYHRSLLVSVEVRQKER